jgi:hypothetical protein
VYIECAFIDYKEEEYLRDERLYTTHRGDGNNVDQTVQSFCMNRIRSIRSAYLRLDVSIESEAAGPKRDSDDDGTTARSSNLMQWRHVSSRACRWPL